MGQVFYMDWEVSLIEWLQKSLGGIGVTLAKAFSWIGDEKGSLIVLLVVLFCWSKAAGKRCGVTIVAVSAWFPMIKNAVLRVRPYIAHPETVQALQPPVDGTTQEQLYDTAVQGYSFPSGHSATAVALYGGIARNLKKKWVRALLLLMPLLIGLSRFAVGAHYPTDVLAGWATGLAALGFVALLEKKVKNEDVRNLILLAIALPGVFWCTSHDYFTALGMMVGLTVAFPYERKYVNFQDTRCVPAMILRVAGAMAVYLGLSVLLKLPFPKEFLDGDTLGANLVRSLRYAVILFVMVGIYPRCFPLFDRLFSRKGRQEE